MQIARSLISSPDTLATAIPDYRTPEQLDRMALFMSGRDFNRTGGWKFAAIKSNRRYLQAENDLVLLKETIKAQAAALEAKDEFIKHLADDLSLIRNPPTLLESAAARSFRFTQAPTYRPGDPRRDLRMRLDSDVCRHTLTYLSGTARQCGLCFQINPLWPGTPLGKPLPYTAETGRTSSETPSVSNTPKEATGYSPAVTIRAELPSNSLCHYDSPVLRFPDRRTGPRLTTTGYSPARVPEEKCPLEFLQADLAALDRLISECHAEDTLGRHSLTSRRNEVAREIAIATDQPVAAPRLTTYNPTPEARAASDQALRRIADEPAPGRIAD